MRAVVVLLVTAACSSYVGTARDTTPSKLAAEPGWTLVRDVPYVAQQTETECGAAAIGMVVAYWTGAPGASVMAQLRPVPKTGIAAGTLRDVARARGLASFVIAGELADLTRELAAGRPVLVGLVKPQRRAAFNHYEVVVGVHRERALVVTLDPAEGWRQNTLEGFLAEWKAAKNVTLIVSAPPAPQAAR